MRLLLAEDERDLSRALCTILEHAGYSVDAVFDGAEALAYLRCGDYDAAILDIMMPRMDGLTALRKARAAGVGTPVLVLTAKQDVDDRVEGLDSGADDYLPKPFAAKELLARVRAITRRRAETTAPVLTFSDLSLDRATCRLSTPQGSVDLPNREFQIMEMLMVNPGARVPTERIMEKVWGWGVEVEVNVVWTYISFLRKRLQRLGAHAGITVARGLGYALERVDDPDGGEAGTVCVANGERPSAPGGGFGDPGNPSAPIGGERA